MRATLLLLCCLTVASAADQRDVVLTAGDYTATLTDHGPVITYEGTVICQGCYLTVFKPKYAGSVVGWTAAWRDGTVTADDHSLRLTAELPGAQVEYLLELSANGVRTTAKVALDEGVEVGPVEYPVFQIPPAVVEGATVEMFNSAGIRIAREAVPDPPARGGFAPGGDELRLRAPDRTLVVTTQTGRSVYPFDARVAQYGKQQGLWAFSSLRVPAGQTTTASFELRVAPAVPPRPSGTVTITGVPATTVATAAAPTAREKFAADELVDYLEQLTGRQLQRTIVAGSAVLPGTICVGRLAVNAGLVQPEELVKLQRDGYLVRVKDGRAAVCGWRDLGAVYGVYALLGQVGVRFYARDCEVVPEVAKLDLPAVELSAVPRYEFRHMSGDLKLGHTPNDDCGNPQDLGQPGGLVHAAEYLVPSEEYGRTHPEYFALQQDGQRLHPVEGQSFNVHLCLANPDVRRISAERMLELIEAQPDRTWFGVSQGDGFAWCTCEQCRALDAVPGVELTDRLLDYVNYVAREVAKKYPDKRLLTLAYTNATSPPPVRVLPEPNVMVQFCPYPRRVACQSHDLTCEQNAVGYADLQGWLAKCPRNMFIFDYPCGYQTWYEPFGTFRAMQRKLAFYDAHGVRGLYYCGVPHTFRELFVYVNSRLLWTPEADVEALLDDFLEHYYGAAAPAMREWFDLLCREVDERPVHQMCEGPNPGLVTADLADQALALCAKAEAAAKGDRAAQFRVRVVAMGVLFADVNERNPVNGKLVVDEATFAQRLAEFLDIARDRRLGTLARREAGVVTDWLYRIARLRTQTNSWYTDPLIERLLADPAGTLAAERQLYAQTRIDGGWRLELDGFSGGKGPEVYAYQCEGKRAVWIYGTNLPQPAMWTKVNLETAPGAARLVLLAQDDDKPGAVGIRVSVNGKKVFEGPNTCREKGWSEQTIPVPDGVLKTGPNEVRLETTGPSSARDAGWFMLAELKLLPE